PIPLGLDELPAAVYFDAALHYVEQYPFNHEFYKYDSKARGPYSYTVDSEWKEKAREYLQACIKTFGSYDAAHEQQEFIRKIIFPCRWKLEELASEMLALVEFIRSETRTTSAVLTPMDIGLPGGPTVVDQVRMHDENCRLTGVGRVNSRATAEELMQRRKAKQATVSKLQVAHGLPFQMGKTSFAFVEALTGIKCKSWVADTIGNTFLAQPPWKADGQIIIRGRTGGGAPDLLGDDPGEFPDTPVRSRFNPAIADIEQKHFILRKFVGDIVWMCGGPEPFSDDDEDNDEDMVVSDINIDTLLEKLGSPGMDLVPREQETMFGSRMVLVRKDTVWDRVIT
ncbi:hypothetical protein B0H15DRAFT_809285, partial [Mycena belliarum]